MWDEQARMIDLVRELNDLVVSAVRPMIGSARAKELAGHAETGDTTFSIDEVAERVVADFLSDHGNIAYYTEDAGLAVPEKPEYLFVIDPIDGTRPAAAGLESCCVSVAVSPYKEEGLETLTLADVFLGVITEIKNRAEYVALRGAGVWFEIDGKKTEPRLSEKTDLESIFWTTGFRGRPASPMVTVLGDLVDLSSVDGGFFDLGSATFDITRVLVGSLDAYVDVGQRIADENPVAREMFLAVGGGAILNNYPYDLAAAALVATESGASVSDASGRSLDSYPLVPQKGGGQMSSIVSSNAVLHGKLLANVDRGFERLARDYGGD